MCRDGRSRRKGKSSSRIENDERRRISERNILYSKSTADIAFRPESVELLRIGKKVITKEIERGEKVGWTLRFA